MPIFIKTIVAFEQVSEFPSDQFRAAALFGLIGAMAMLIAVSTGEQGVWL
jgi:hypothetical protein